MLSQCHCIRNRQEFRGSENISRKQHVKDLYCYIIDKDLLEDGFDSFRKFPIDFHDG